MTIRNLINNVHGTKEVPIASITSMRVNQEKHYFLVRMGDVDCESSCTRTCN